MISCPVCGGLPTLGDERVRYCTCRRLRGYPHEPFLGAHNWEFSARSSILSRPSLVVTENGLCVLALSVSTARPVQTGHEESAVGTFIEAALCDEVLGS